MQSVISLTAEAREDAGKGVARALRRQGKIPAIVYSKGHESVKLALSLKDVTLAFNKGGFFNKLVDITVDGQQLHVLPRDVQTHPVTDIIEHVDFQQVRQGAQIQVMVPVRVVNQDRSVGVKRGGILNLVRHEIALLCNADAIPSEITIDVLNVDIGHSVHIGDIELPKNAVPAGKQGNFTLVTIAGRSGKEEEERPAAEAAAKPADAKAAGKPAAAKPAGKDDKKK
jgi:large subunit ribosomal protein L25